jgi:4-alpha-glucanotransferase
MKIHFFLRYTTTFGQSLQLQYDLNGQRQHLPMTYLNQEFWMATLEVPDKSAGTLQYSYIQHDSRQNTSRQDWESNRQLDLNAMQVPDIQVVDTWNWAGDVQNAFNTQPFRTQPVAAPAAKTKAKAADWSVEFRIKVPLLPAGQVPCIVGAGLGLHDWSRTQPILLQPQNGWWVAKADLREDSIPVSYKYGLWDTATKTFVRFEEGDNRSLYHAATQPAKPKSAGGVVIVHDGFFRSGAATFKGAGVAIPVFSLRSEKSGGVGEFTDMPLLADWAASIGLKIIQLLPINDTSATDTWTDSYPYASITAFGLHPLYLNISEVAGKKHAALVKKQVQALQALNSTEHVDYEQVMTLKWEAVTALYAVLKAEMEGDSAYQGYFNANKHWLRPYAAFCYLKGINGTTDFNQWKTHSQYDEKEIETLLSPKQKHYDAVAIHYFVQWHLHRQLKAATDYLHTRGLSVKGDIPIGIYRHSADAWVAPELYNMGRQSGAPPDDFAADGQNWGFPTYNWDRMKADGFAWWRQRFEQMSHYFDAFRIDHILGFFRIWSIPLEAVQGILGQFVPAIPIREEELWQAGIGFDYERLCRPYITERVLWETFSDDAGAVRTFVQPNAATGRLELLPAFDTQRKVEAYFSKMPDTPDNQRLRDGLYTLIANVILLDLPGEEGPVRQGAWRGAFRFGIDKTSSFRHLDGDIQQRLNSLYVNYFYRRQDEFWEREAYDKLPALKRTTDMLICGEDLGMVPDCVPGVMRELGILSLEIQRMPKSPKETFFHPKTAPYLSVVTPSTHDMSTIRGWWEEDCALTQRFYNEQLGQQGDAPFFCEPWINRAIVEQHVYSPAMWSIFQLQDLMGMDGDLRRDNPAEERINVPANPKHYWRYRMHLTLEALAQADAFNGALHEMVVRSGRS